MWLSLFSSRLSGWLVSGRTEIGAQVLNPEPILLTTFLYQLLLGLSSDCCLSAIATPLLTWIGTMGAITMRLTSGRCRPRPQRGQVSFSRLHSRSTLTEHLVVMRKPFCHQLSIFLTFLQIQLWRSEGYHQLYLERAKGRSRLFLTWRAS